MTPNNAAFAKFIALPFAAVLVLGSIIGSNLDGGSKNEAPVSVANSCKADWTKCADNADMANTYKDWFSAKYGCKNAASKLARFGTPEWPWLYFGTFLKGNDYATKGIAVLFEDGAKFQNGFGAMAHVEVRCEYDLRAKKVIDVTISAK